MQVSSLNTYLTGTTGSRFIYQPAKQPVVLDSKSGLYSASMPGASANDTGEIFVYSKNRLAAGKPVSETAIILQNTGAQASDNEYFTLDLDVENGDLAKLVSTDTGYDLYVYSPGGGGAQAADKYSFDTAGVLKEDGHKSLTALELSSEEITTKRDLDGNGVVGAKLLNKEIASDGVSEKGIVDAVGGLYQASILGETMFVVGAGLDRSKTIDAAQSVLKNTDGTTWVPDDLDSYSSFKATLKDGAWTVYGTNGDATVTKFTFDAEKKLVGSPELLDAVKVASAEKSMLRDLNADNIFGLQVAAQAIDANGGLYKGSLMGSDFYVVGSALKSGTKPSSAVDTTMALMVKNGNETNAWAVPDGYEIKALVKDPTVANKYAVYTVNQDDAKEIIRFDFTKFNNGTASDASDDYLQLDPAEVEGVVMSASDLTNAKAFATAEKTARRDLNGDGDWGIKMKTPAADAVGGLSRATALGGEYFVVGKNLTSTQAKPLDLTTALHTEEGAWAPEGVNLVTFGTNESEASIKIVSELGAGNAVTGYSVYVKDDVGGFAKYSFDATYRQTGSESLSIEDMAEAEKTTKRDLSGDGSFGVKIAGASLDLVGGLYKGSFEGSEDVYIRSTGKLAAGSVVAAKAVDFASALKSEDGVSYWSVDDGYDADALKAFTDTDGNFTIVATSVDDPNKTKAYVFDDQNTIVSASTKEMTRFELAQMEGAQKRDLNSDGTVGVRIGNSDTIDKIGGLFKGSVADDEFLLVGSFGATAVKDLSTALLNENGEAWKPEDYTDAMSMTLVVKGTKADPTGFEVYTKGADNEFKKYTFGDDYKLKEDGVKTLTALEVATDEMTTGRDINGDKVKGVKQTTIVDGTSGLYKIKLNSDIADDAIVINQSGPSKTSDWWTSGVMLQSDGVSSWQLPDTDEELGFALKSAVSGSDGIQIYAVKSGGSSVMRYNFDENRVYLDQQELTAEEFAQAEKLAEADLNKDASVGAVVDKKAIDKTGGLYKASLLGQDFYVLGNNLTTGTVANTAGAVDLSSALKNSAEVAWSPEADVGEGFKVGGVIKTDDGYDVYSYLKDGSNVSRVVKTSWDNSFAYMGQEDADPVNLVALETEQKRDVSGDGAVGFLASRALNTDTYRGVTAAKVLGAERFWLVGENQKSGTTASALTVSNALLNSDGTGAWAFPEADADFVIKAVDDEGSDRVVYAVKNAGEASEEVKKFSFSKETGRSLDDGVNVTAIELAAKEKELSKDLNGDKFKGVTGATVASVGEYGKYTVLGKTRKTGLLEAKMMGDTYLVEGAKPNSGTLVDLNKVLLNQDNTAWKPSETFSVKGSMTNASGQLEVYGLDSNLQVKQFKFEKSESGDTYSWMLLEGDDGPETAISNRDLAATEIENEADLNGDGAFGFKKVGGSSVLQTPKGWALDKADIGTNAVAPTATDAAIYIVANSLSNLTKAGTDTTTNKIQNAALFESASQYWAPEEGYSIKSIDVVTANAENTVQVWAEKSVDPDATGPNDAKTYLKYEFKKDDNQWVLDSVATAVTSDELVTAESSAKRDLNNDNVVGLKAEQSLIEGLMTAKINDKTYYMVPGTGTIASGTATKPLDFTSTKLLKTTDGTSPWVPPEGVIVTNLAKVEDADLIAEGKIYEIVATGDANYYFGSDMKLVA